MATLPRLLADVRPAFGTRTRIWLTEYGYQTNPPDRLPGVTYAAQARYLAEGALRAYQAPRVDILVHYLARDEPAVGRWQSGLFTVRGEEWRTLGVYRTSTRGVFERTVRAGVGARFRIWSPVLHTFSLIAVVD